MSAPRTAVVVRSTVAVALLLFVAGFAGLCLAAVPAAAAPPYVASSGALTPDTSALGAEPTIDPSAPVATLSVSALSTSASKTASFKVSWKTSPTLPVAGYDAYRVEYREPGVDYWLVWQAATTAASATFLGQAGHAYVFRAAAAKTGDATVVGPWSTVRPVAVPADEAAFTYTKTWKRTSVSGAYFGRIRFCATKGATATFKFKGTKAALIAPRGRALGKVAVYVRSATSGGWTAYKLIKTIDLYAKTTKARVATTFGAWDPAVVRQAKLVVTGKKNLRSTSTKVSLDGLAVYGAPHATGEYAVELEPQTPSVVITKSLQLTASVPGCLDQRVTWKVERYDRFGNAYTDGAGSITAGGLYTAPGLPAKTTGEDQRSYYVTARAVANPDRVVGTRQIQVAPWPSPTIDSDASPSSGAAGSTVTLHGDYFTHPDPDVGLQVFFSSRELEVVGSTETTATVRIPSEWQSQWDTTMTANMYAVTTAEPTPTSWHRFTITGIKPSPPSPWTINAAGTDDDNASVGDELRIYGQGFSPIAEQNIVRFGGAQAVASRYEAGVPGTYGGTLFVKVPEGAGTGALQFRRSDGDGRWSTEDLQFTVVPATQVAAGLHPSYGGRYIGPRLVSNGYWSLLGQEEEWLLQGVNFSKLRNADYETSPGAFWIDIQHGGHTYSRVMRAVTDTVAVPYRDGGPQEMFPEEVFGDVPAGATVQLRVRGNELTNRYERTSAWTTVTLGERPYYGSLYNLPAVGMVAWWGPSKTIAKGSWLRITHGGSQATQSLTAPGLWPGTLPMGADGVAVKLVPLPTTGTYTITNQTSGESTQLVVADVGRPDGGGGYGSDTQTDLQSEGLRMRVDGSEITVPPGAFWDGDLTPVRQYFSIRVDHFPSPLEPWDPTITDGGHIFSVSVTPTVTRLLKPITITIPYETTGRAGQPFLGMWDPGSRLYYDFGVASGQVDTANRRITYVIPAGTYPGQSASRAPARGLAARDGADDGVAGPAADVLGSAPGGRSLNDSFRQVGAVSSKVATTDQEFVWTSPRNDSWGIRVDAVTDPSSSSYVPPEKAQEVLDVAADTWENLVRKGWSEPEARISITVRDYGDPGVYQGATTKAVFGQPWVYVNSRLTMGKKLDTAVSHEMGHVFQRQLTTNVATYWIDEAVAEWVAWDTLGPGRCDLQASFEAGCDFPAAAFPTSFVSGYSTEQAYGAGAFIIWLADTYGAAAVLDIYDTLAYRPGYWYDAHGTFSEATGKSVPQLVFEFAPAFWLQTYEPISAYSFWSRVYAPISAYTGTTRSLSMGADSSCSVSVTPTAEFRPSLIDKPMVARAPGLPDGALVDVYRDTAPSGAVPAAPLRIGTLSSLTPILDLGTFDGTIGCYRLIAVTPAATGLAAQVTIEAVHLASVSPAGGSKAGGYNVTLRGCGFGDQPATVMVGAASANGGDVVSWSDTEIVFRMPNMGTSTGPQAVQVLPAIGGASNTVTITTF